MASKLRYLITRPITRLLTAELEKADPSDEVVVRCLKMGADPMARLNDGSSVFFAIALKRPISESMNAWFQAVDGQLKDWPWNGKPTPLDDVLPYQGVTAQPEGYSLTLLRDLHNAGLNIASLDTPERSLVSRVFNTYPQEAASVMIQLSDWYRQHTFHATPEQRMALDDLQFPLYLLEGRPQVKRKPR